MVAARRAPFSAGMRAHPPTKLAANMPFPGCLADPRVCLDVSSSGGARKRLCLNLKCHPKGASAGQSTPGGDYYYCERPASSPCILPPPILDAVA